MDPLDIGNLKEAAIPTREIRDDELQGCIVPVFLLSKWEDLVERFGSLLDASRRTQWRSELLNADLVQLLIDLDDERKRRTALYKMRRQLERREAEYSLPTYFWRPEKNRTVEDMLRRRAGYLLYKARAGVDDVWALLQEFNEDYSGCPLDAEALMKIILEARNAPVRNAS